MNSSTLIGLAGQIVGQILSNPLVITGLMVIAGVTVAAWLLAVFWVFHETTYRTDSVLARYLAATWILVSGPLLLPISLTVFNLVRPLESAAERRVGQMLEAMHRNAADVLTCAVCDRELDPRWVRCPGCGTWAGWKCGRCQQLAPADADVCPWCAWEPQDAPLADERIAAAAEAAVAEPAPIAIAERAARNERAARKARRHASPMTDPVAVTPQGS